MDDTTINVKLEQAEKKVKKSIERMFARNKMYDKAIKEYEKNRAIRDYLRKVKRTQAF